MARETFVELQTNIMDRWTGVKLPRNSYCLDEMLKGPSRQVTSIMFSRLGKAPKINLNVVVDIFK